MVRVASKPQERVQDENERVPVVLPHTADIVNSAHREFSEMGLSMLKKNVVAMVFLPWLTRYTGQLIRSAKEEERRAILAALPVDNDVREKDPHFLRGRSDTLKLMRELILARSEAPLPSDTA